MQIVRLNVGFTNLDRKIREPYRNTPDTRPDLEFGKYTEYRMDVILDKCNFWGRLLLSAAQNIEVASYKRIILLSHKQYTNLNSAVAAEGGRRHICMNVKSTCMYRTVYF